MSAIKLKQGTYTGLTKEGVNCYFGIPFAEPFQRFQQPQPVDTSDKHEDASERGHMPPQGPLHMDNVMAEYPAGTGTQDEQSCSVLSIYVPERASSERRPVIAWFCGGGFISGGSETPFFDGSKLAKDGDVIVVCITYRAGPFGFLYREGEGLQQEKLPPGVADVVAGLEWIQSNAAAFGGDKDNVTVFGQSAGGYLIQCIFDRRPDLFRKAIIQSSPAAYVAKPEDGRTITASVVEALKGKALEDASVDDLIAAQFAAIVKHPEIVLAFCPVSDNLTAPGRSGIAQHKDVLIGWTKDDALCLVQAKSPGVPVADLDRGLTDYLFRGPLNELADVLTAQGHSVTRYELIWEPPGYELGATHCVDLPLCFGDEEAWKGSPMLGTCPWEEWERRGHRHRLALAQFARDGTKLVSHDGLHVF